MSEQKLPFVVPHAVHRRRPTVCPPPTKAYSEPRPNLLPMKRGRGFTLVELIVTLAVVGVLLAVAIPGFRQLIGSNRLTTGANEFVLAIVEARAEAIRRNTAVQICAAAGANGTGALADACNGSAPGATYLLDTAGAAQLVRAAPALPAGTTLVNATALRYNGQGLARAIGGTTPYNGRVLDLRSAQLESDNHRCIYMTTGSSLKTCTTSADCDANTEPTGCQ